MLKKKLKTHRIYCPLVFSSGSFENLSYKNNKENKIQTSTTNLYDTIKY